MKTTANTDNIIQELDRCGQAFIVSKNENDTLHLTRLFEEEGVEVFVEPKYHKPPAKEMQDEMTGISYMSKVRPVFLGYKIIKL